MSKCDLPRNKGLFSEKGFLITWIPLTDLPEDSELMFATLTSRFIGRSQGAYNCYRLGGGIFNGVH